jgi:plastocyanin
MTRFLLVSTALLFVGCDADDSDTDPMVDEDDHDADADDSDTDPMVDDDDHDDDDDDTPDDIEVVVDCATVTATERVYIDTLAFSPAEITIAAGDVVQWFSRDGAHTVTSGNPGDSGALFDSGTLVAGAWYCLQFNAVDSVEYFCERHPEHMDDGLVTVE